MSSLNSSLQELRPYVSPLPGEGQDELEHYRLQVRVMTDIVNVSEYNYSNSAGLSVLLYLVYVRHLVFSMSVRQIIIIHIVTIPSTPTHPHPAHTPHAHTHTPRTHTGGAHTERWAEVRAVQTRGGLGEE